MVLDSQSVPSQLLGWWLIKSFCCPPTATDELCWVMNSSHHSWLFPITIRSWC